MSLASVSEERLTVMEPGIRKPRLSENSVRVLRARYLKKDEDGQCIESPAELFHRVARAIAEVETLYNPSPENRSDWEERFYELMVSLRFLPNSPTLMNAGREMGMLSACFVLPVGDSIQEIFDSIKYTALIQKAGGGTGFAFDELRPTGDYISSSGGTTSGPISFWRAFSEATNAIQQGAFRRGANMGMMYIDHPDILKFLDAKQDLTQFTNYNISVKVTDAWMEAFRSAPDGPHVVTNPRTKDQFLIPRDVKIWEYDVRDLVPATAPDGVAEGERYYTRRDIWDIIIQHAWQTGEPGVVFIDRINQANPTPHIGRMEATNPCGEQPLLPFEACNLGSINLAPFVRDGGTAQAQVDWDALGITVHEATRFLDNVIDANRYPLPQIDRICKANRKIGLGIMGFADALYLLGVGYNTEEGVTWGERFMKFVNDESHAASEQLAKERGSFPNWEGSTWDTDHHRSMRNATCTTVAPTGTISMIGGCSGGIEPLFSLVFVRNVLKEQKRDGSAPMLEANPIFRRVAEQRGFLSEGLMDRIATDGTLARSFEVSEDVRRVFVCAHDIVPEWHMRMQAAFQKHCDASISKTINFPEEATPEDVETIYRMAYDLSCKGVTVYRNGCRACQPMALKEGKNHDAPSKTSAQEMPEPMELPQILCSLRIRQVTPFGNMHVQITVDPKTECEQEVFAQLGKGGDLANSDLEAICRLTSLWLRSRGSLSHVIKQLKGIGSSLQVSTKHGRIMSLGDGVAQALLKYVRAKTAVGLRNLLLGEYEIADLEADPAERMGLPGATSDGGNGHGKPRHRDDQRTVSTALSYYSTVSLNEKFKVCCPNCQHPLRITEGCELCEACGYAKC